MNFVGGWYRSVNYFGNLVFLLLQAEKGISFGYSSPSSNDTMMCSSILSCACENVKRKKYA